MKNIIKIILSKITKTDSISVELHLSLSLAVKSIASNRQLKNILIPPGIEKEEADILEIKIHKRRFKDKFLFLSKYWPLCNISHSRVLERVNALNFARKYYLKRNKESNSLIYKEHQLFFIS